MSEIVVMPKMNLTMESGLLAYWYKQLGDPVASGEPLCSIENEKETEDLPSPAGGVIVRMWAAAEEHYKVGTPLCLIAAAGEDVSALIAQAEGRGEEQKAAAVEQEAPANPAGSGGTGFRILPKVRSLAKQSGISVEELKAFFGNVPINEAHIGQFLAHKASIAPSLGSGKRIRLSPMRKTIAENMALSASKTARLTNFMEVDMTASMAQVSELKRQGTGISVTALLIKACATALREHEIINTVLDEQKEEILYRDEINIGFAVDVPGGLVVPVIRNADGKSVFELTQELAVLTRAAQDGSISHEEMRGGTFTVSNVGMLGIDSFTPIIRYPETAILGAGEIKTLPRYLGEDLTTVHPRKIMKIGLTYDHRVIDGAPASRFLQSVRQLLESGTVLFQ